MSPPGGDVEDITKALGVLTRCGLPAPDDKVPEALVKLRGVIARSVHPDERASRVDAFNRLILDTIARVEDDFDREALRYLFRLDKNTAKATLTTRRTHAAALRHYDNDHFRKRIEPRLLGTLALTLHRDSLRYKSRTRRAPSALEPTGDTPKLTADDLTAQEELISRIWAEVYSLRAELIAAGRLQADEQYLPQVEEHRLQAHVHDTRLKEMIREYIDTYGDRYIKHGDNEFAVEGLARLAEWSLG